MKYSLTFLDLYTFSFQRCTWSVYFFTFCHCHHFTLVLLLLLPPSPYLSCIMPYITAQFKNYFKMFASLLSVSLWGHEKDRQRERERWWESFDVVESHGNCLKVTGRRHLKSHTALKQRGKLLSKCHNLFPSSTMSLSMPFFPICISRVLQPLILEVNVRGRRTLFAFYVISVVLSLPPSPLPSLTH